MKILALETSSELCSTALLIDNQVLSREIRDRKHSTSVLPMFDELLAEARLTLADIDAVAFGRGPGMFTGIRIGAGIAQGAAFAAGKPVIPVSSLKALAAGVNADRVLAVQDARMNEVYCCAYECITGNGYTSCQPLTEEQLVKPAEISLPSSGKWVLAGTACIQYRDQLLASLGDSIERMDDKAFPLAGQIAMLASQDLEAGYSVNAEDALPVYLRNNVARKKGET